MSLFAESSQEDIQKAVEEFNDDVIKKYVADQCVVMQIFTMQAVDQLRQKINTELIPEINEMKRVIAEDIQNLQYRIADLEHEVRRLGGNV